jgi:hypothetical protein
MSVRSDRTCCVADVGANEAVLIVAGVNPGSLDPVMLGVW